MCEAAGIFRRKDAQKLLRMGSKRGAVSERFVGGWPIKIWAITDDGAVPEARRDAVGSYHGYSLPPGDPYHDAVFKFWNLE